MFDMKNLKYLLVIVALLFVSGVVQAKKGKKEKEVYLCGVASAFGDTIISITDIQKLSGTELLDKNDFLFARNQYAYQFKGYLENTENLPYRTCAILFAKKKSKLEKRIQKLKAQYDGGSMKLRTIGSDKFKFVKFEE